MEELKELVSRMNEICFELVQDGKEVKFNPQVKYGASVETVGMIHKMRPIGFDLGVEVLCRERV